MCEVKYVKAEKMFPIINEILDNGNGVRLTVTGSSMYPFLRESVDSVELYTGNYNNIYRGDIALIHRSSGEYILHRVVKKEKDCFYFAGDAQTWIEGPVMPNQLIALVKVVWRRNKSIKCSNILWKASSMIWLWLIPFRKIIYKIYRFAVSKMW